MQTILSNTPENQFGNTSRSDTSFSFWHYLLLGQIIKNGSVKEQVCHNDAPSGSSTNSVDWLIEIGSNIIVISKRLVC